MDINLYRNIVMLLISDLHLGCRVWFDFDVPAYSLIRGASSVFPAEYRRRADLAFAFKLLNSQIDCPYPLTEDQLPHFSK